jgi:putative transcriptional regulator
LPLSKSELAKLKPVSLAKKVRWKLGLSQTEFAARYDIAVGTLRDWEQCKSKPDRAAKNYLRVILALPDETAKALRKPLRAA